MTDRQMLELLVDKMSSFELNQQETNQHLSVIETDVTFLKQDLTSLNDTVSTLKQDLSVLNDTVSILKQDLSVLNDTVSILKQDYSSMNDTVSILKQDFSSLSDTVSKNYDLLEEFYVYQKEFNTEMIRHMKIIEGELDMHTNQIAKNTSDIKLYK